MRIRDASAGESPVLESLQRRSSAVWEAYREQLANNPDAIELPEGFYEKLGFAIYGETQTRFGPAVRTRRDVFSRP